MSSDNPIVIPVPFHGDTIIAVETAEATYVAIKPICERLGLSDRAQRKRLAADPEFWGGTVMVLPSAGGMQETYCIPVSRVAAWLFTVEVSRVKPEIRDALMIYRREAADVLDRHFRQKQADLSFELIELRRRLAYCQDLLLAVMPGWAQIRHAWEKGMWRDIHRRLRWSFTRCWEEQQIIAQTGILPAGDAPNPEPLTQAAYIHDLELRLKAAGLWDHKPRPAMGPSDLEWQLRRKEQRVGVTDAGQPDLFEGGANA